MLGAWDGHGGLVVLVEQGEDRDVPVEHHVKHPLIHFGSSIYFLLFWSLIMAYWSSGSVKGLSSFLFT